MLTTTDQSAVSALESATSAAVTAFFAIPEDARPDACAFVGQHLVANAPGVAKEFKESGQAWLVEELRRLTPAQAEAASAAAKHMEDVAAKMQSVPAAERHAGAREGKVVDWALHAWEAFGGGVDVLMQHTPLVDLEYLVKLTELGGVMPAGRQRMPKAAFITEENVWRLMHWVENPRGQHTINYKHALPILVFSYPWLDWWHPDRKGAQMRRVLPILQAMLKEAKRDSPFGTVGVMIDFMCLPQKPFSTAAEEAQFKTSLTNINQWYFHKYLYTLLITPPPPEGADYTNTRLHSQRGWCAFERAASMVTKAAQRLLDFGHYRGAAEFSRGVETGLWQVASGWLGGEDGRVWSRVLRERVG